MFSGITETFQAAHLDQAANIAVVIENCDFSEDFEVRLVEQTVGEESSAICFRIVRADGFSAELLTRVRLEVDDENLCMTTNTRYPAYLDIEEMAAIAHLSNKLIAGSEDLLGEYIQSAGTVVHVFGAEVDRCVLDAPPEEIQPFFIDLMKRIILSGAVFLGFISSAESGGTESFVSRYDYTLDDEDLLSIADLMHG